MLKSFFKNASSRLADERLYDIVATELHHEVRRPGIWAQAFAKSKGDESLAEAHYIELRVQSLRDEIEVHTKRKKILELEEKSWQLKENELKLKEKSYTEEVEQIIQSIESNDYISVLKLVRRYGYNVTIQAPYGKSLEQTFNVQMPSGKRKSFKDSASFMSFIKTSLVEG